MGGRRERADKIRTCFGMLSVQKIEKKEGKNEFFYLYERQGINLHGYRLEITEYLSGFLHLISIDTFKEYFVQLPGPGSWMLLCGANILY